MKAIRFFGYNDDLVHYKINGKEEEINSDHVNFGLVSKEGMMRVVVRYDGNGGIWGAYPLIWDEGEEFPDWKIYVSKEHEYSMYLLIETPNDTKIVVLEK